MDKDSFSRYYTIPDKLWAYDGEKICASAKLLYPLLVSLSKNEGYCYATNKYLGRIMKRSVSSVSKFIKQLSDEGFISIKITRNNTMRYIYIVPIQKVKPICSDEEKANIKRIEDVSASLLYNMRQNFKNNQK